MKTIFLFLFLIYGTTLIYAQVTQEWVAVYQGADNPWGKINSIALDSSGNVYVIAIRKSGSASNSGYTTIKYNSVGIEQWHKHYDGTGNGDNIAYAIGVDGSGNVYVTGTSQGIGTSKDYATVKYNTDGVEQWVQRYDGPNNTDDRAQSIAVDGSGDVYVTGESDGVGTSSDYATIKYNADGVEQWVKIYNGPGNSNDLGYRIAVDGSGNVYVTGSSSPGIGAEYDYTTIKYNSDGVQQWVQIYNGPGNGNDEPFSIAVDGSGNVYVTGESVGSGTYQDYATIKYNTDGVQQWVQRYNGTGNVSDFASSIGIDSSGNVYVTGGSYGDGTDWDYATIKYNSDGVQQWVQIYNGPNNINDIANSIALDDSGNVYVTGDSYGGTKLYYDYTTLKYNSDGVQQWVQIYNGPGNSDDHANSIAVDGSSNVYVTGYIWVSETEFDYTTIKYSQGLSITSPLAGEKWIAGETDTIRWIGGQAGQFLDIDFTTDTATGSYETIIQSYPADSGHYVWNIPNNILSHKCKISIEDTSNPTNLAFSEVFKIKGYVLTRNYSNGNYDPYSKFRDPWSFANDSSSLWPRSWWERFDYSGTDPFTGYNYLLGPLGLFLTANSSDFPDWVSWVRTFGVNACYFRTSFPPIYSPSAVLKWTVNAVDWGGSCFGMSTSNALIFKNNTQFIARYPTFPNSNPPISISPTDTVKTVINELFTHQIGKEHLQFRSSVGLLKTPNETLRDIKKMLVDDNEPIRTLSITSNDPTDPGGHSILAFKVEQDTSFRNIYYVFVYDNAYPSNLDSAIIIIDTLANNGTGTWSPTYAWQNWGGNEWFYLRDPATNYLTNPTIPKQQLQSSPFIIDEDELQIYNTRAASILITDQQGNNSGYYNGVLINEIPDAFPNIIDNGSSGPPIGYNLSLADYSLTMNNYIDGNSRVSFFTGNKSFSYHRVNAQSTETDQLFFYGGVSYSNPDLIIKPINLISILNETIQEKAFAFNNVSMMQNDSVKLEYPDEDKIKLISYGSAKNYSLSIEFAKEIGYGSFENDNISLSINTSHTIVPNWADIINSTLTILVDEGNNGTIDDTLYVDNTVDVEDQGNLLAPTEYNLAQNYPNPFNPVTTIQYSIPQRSVVILKVYDILGNEVATLINEDRERGVYSVNFDASGLASGMYLYRLQAGSFVETKKMILLK